MTLAEPQIHRWTFDQYIKLAEDGLLGEKRVELIEGEILDMAPQQNPHAIAVSKIVRVLMENFPEPYFVKVQATHRLDDHSAPEPDVVLLAEYPGGRKAAAAVPLLVVEVSDATLVYDQTKKASLYSAHGVLDYWIVNVIQRQLEVYRNPAVDSEQRFGWRYSNCRVIQGNAIVSPLHDSSAKISIARLLP